MEEEKQKDEINNSKSAIILKTIYAILIFVIFVNCIILISSILFKADPESITSKKQVIVKDSNTDNNDYFQEHNEEHFEENAEQIHEENLEGNTEFEQVLDTQDEAEVI